MQVRQQQIFEQIKNKIKKGLKKAIVPDLLNIPVTVQLGDEPVVGAAAALFGQDGSVHPGHAGLAAAQLLLLLALHHPQAGPGVGHHLAG